MLYDGDTFTVRVHKFVFEAKHDESGRRPWEDYSIYDDVVSNWVTRDKKPHERILTTVEKSKRFFNVKKYLNLAKSHGCTKKQAADQLETSFKHLQDWCNDHWHYIGVCVTLLDDEGDRTNTTESLWGVEDSDQAYIEKIARELAVGIAQVVDKEALERTYWANRDVITI